MELSLKRFYALVKQLVLHSVLHVPNLACNLVSINKLTKDLNCLANFYNDMCLIQGQGLEKMIGIAR